MDDFLAWRKHVQLKLAMNYFIASRKENWRACGAERMRYNYSYVLYYLATYTVEVAKLTYVYWQYNTILKPKSSVPASK